MTKYARFTVLSILLVFALVLVACGGGAQQGAEPEAPAEEAWTADKEERRGAEPTVEDVFGRSEE